jgi:hypothetical protein
MPRDKYRNKSAQLVEESEEENPLSPPQKERSKNSEEVLSAALDEATKGILAIAAERKREEERSASESGSLSSFDSDKLSPPSLQELQKGEKEKEKSYATIAAQPAKEKVKLRPSRPDGKYLVGGSPPLSDAERDKYFPNLKVERNKVVVPLFTAPTPKGVIIYEYENKREFLRFLKARVPLLKNCSLIAEECFLKQTTVPIEVHCTSLGDQKEMMREWENYAYKLCTVHYPLAKDDEIARKQRERERQHDRQVLDDRAKEEQHAKKNKQDSLLKREREKSAKSSSAEEGEVADDDHSGSEDDAPSAKQSKEDFRERIAHNTIQFLKHGSGLWPRTLTSMEDEGEREKELNFAYVLRSPRKHTLIRDRPCNMHFNLQVIIPPGGMLTLLNLRLHPDLDVKRQSFIMGPKGSPLPDLSVTIFFRGLERKGTYSIERGEPVAVAIFERLIPFRFSQMKMLDAIRQEGIRHSDVSESEEEDELSQAERDRNRERRREAKALAWQEDGAKDAREVINGRKQAENRSLVATALAAEPASYVSPHIDDSPRYREVATELWTPIYSDEYNPYPGRARLNEYDSGRRSYNGDFRNANLRPIAGPSYGENNENGNALPHVGNGVGPPCHYGNPLPVSMGPPGFYPSQGGGAQYGPPRYGRHPFRGEYQRDEPPTPPPSRKCAPKHWENV